MFKMSTNSDRQLMRLQVGGLPLVDEIMRRMRLRQILGDTIPASERGSIPAVDAVKDSGSGLYGLLPKSRSTCHCDPARRVGEAISLFMPFRVRLPRRPAKRDSSQ